MFLMSTDKFYEEYLNSMRKKIVVEPNYCTFNVMHGVGCGNITVSNALALAVNLGNNCVLGYDKDLCELIIVPKITGNIKVSTKCGSGTTKRVNAARFLRAVGFTDDTMPTGRYLVRLDDDGNIRVMLNQKLKNSGEMRQKRL